MRLPSARALFFLLARGLAGFDSLLTRGPAQFALCAAALWLASCAVGSARSEYDRGDEPNAVTQEPPEPPEVVVAKPPRAWTGDESTGDIIPDRPMEDAGAPIPPDAQTDGGAVNTLLEVDSGLEGGTADAAKRCVRGSRSLATLSVDERVRYTVLIDETYIYYQNVVGESAMRLRQDIMAVPRAALFDASFPVTPITILRDDYAIDSLLNGNDGFLYFMAMPQGDRMNQGLFRIVKRERAAAESLPIHALASDDYWPGQLAMDESYFYLASVGGGSRTLRIVRIARSNGQREELWLNMSASNDSSSLGAMSLEQGDIALDASHVYFSARINRASAPHQFRVYQLNKEGHHQTPVLLAALDDTYGGLASDGAHLYFSHAGNLEQHDLASGARERLVPQAGMLDLSYADGVLSWTPSNTGSENLDFFCL